MRNIIKPLGIYLFICLCLIFTSCEKDDTFEQVQTGKTLKEGQDPYDHLSALGLTHRVIELEQDSDLKAFIASKANASGKSISGAGLQTPYGTIILEEINQVTDSLGNVSSTFDIEPVVYRFNEFSNFVVEKRASGTTTAKVITYRPDYEFMVAFSRGQATMHDFKGVIKEYDADQYLDAVTNRMDCFSIPTPCAINDNSDPDTGNGDTTDDGDISEPDVSDGNSNGGGSGGGGGTTGLVEPSIQSQPDSSGGGCTLTTISQSCGSGRHFGSSSCRLPFKGYSIQITVCNDSKSSGNTGNSWQKREDIGCDGDKPVSLNYISFKGMPKALNLDAASLAYLNADCNRAKLSHTFLETFDFSAEARKAITDALKVVTGQRGLNTLDSILAHKAYLWLMGHHISSTNAELGGVAAKFIAMDPDNSKPLDYYRNFAKSVEEISKILESGTEQQKNFTKKLLKGNLIAEESVEIFDFVKKENWSNEAMEFANWEIEFKGLPSNPCGLHHDCLKSIEKMAWGLRKFHGEDGKLMAEYFESVIADTSSMTIGDVQSFYDTAKAITDQYNVLMRTAVLGGFAEGVLPILEIALFEVGGTVALKLIQKIPLSWVLRATTLNKTIEQVGLLGKRGAAGNHIREVITNAPIAKSKELFNSLTKNAISKVTESNGAIKANMGNSNFIIYRPASASTSNFPATITLDFRAAGIWTKQRQIKFITP